MANDNDNKKNIKKAKVASAVKSVTKPASVSKPVKNAAASSKKETKSNVKSELNTQNIMEAYMTKSKTNFGVSPEKAADAGKEQLEAIVKSGDIFAKGFESIFKSYVSLTQSSAEKSAETFQAFINCKSPDELSGIQELAQKGYDEWVSGTTVISEQYVKVTTDAFVPISDQINKVVETVSKEVAA